MRVTLGGKYWKLKRVKRVKYKGKEVDGLCNFTLQEIKICKALDGQTELHTLVHESIHALYPWMEEDKVTSTAQELSSLLHKLGYRKLQVKGNGAT